MHEIHRVLVVGAGQMGSQIALQLALHGFDVTLQDLFPEGLERAMTSNRDHLKRLVERGRISPEDAEQAGRRLIAEPNLEQAAAQADLAIEAISEELDAKRAIFAQLDRLCPPHTVLCSNSSTFMISDISAGVGRKNLCANMHWFYPPLVMRLVEVVKGSETSEETVQQVAEVVRQVNREPVVLRKESQGFLVNRVVYAIFEEAFSILEEGVASFADIDKALELGLNHPMGPFKLGDFSGLDVVINGCRSMYEANDNPNGPLPKALQDRVDRGDWGRKTGKGFYDWSFQPPAPTED